MCCKEYKYQMKWYIEKLPEYMDNPSSTYRGMSLTQAEEKAELYLVANAMRRGNINNVCDVSASFCLNISERGKQFIKDWED